MSEWSEARAQQAFSRVLPRRFYDRSAEQVARELLGQWLVRRVGSVRKVGCVVETEAYLGTHDRASHSSKGRTARNEVMFGPPGHAYVYLIYGMHHCVNAVTGAEGEGAAVLIRAVEPLWGIEGNTRGPGRLCRVLEIDKALNGLDLTDRASPLILASPEKEQATEFEIDTGPRIGVDYAGEWAQRHLRFQIRGNPYVSRKRA